MMIKISLRKELIRLLGQEGISDAMEERICYAYDATRENRLPDAVVFPETVMQISGIMKLANREKIPVVPRGAGSGFSGGSLPVSGGLVMAMKNFDRIVEIDSDNLQAVVEPAVVTSHLQAEVEKIGLFYPPDPASMNFSTIGGNIAENSGGMRAVKYGVTKDYVMGLEVVLPDGEIIHSGSKCVKDVVGYNLTQLFVGSEGTLGIITKAILKLLPLPETRETLTAAFSSMQTAGKTVSDIIRNRIIPTTTEFMDKYAIRLVEDYLHLGLPLDAEALLLIETDGDAEQAEKNIRRVKAVCEANMAVEIRIARNEKERNDLWKARRSVSTSLGKLGAVKVNEDIVVPRSRVPDIIEKIEEIREKHNVLIVNFGHAGDGNIHVNMMSNRNEEDLERVHEAAGEIFRAAIDMGGRISGEHGIGITKRNYIGWNIEAPTLNLMKKIKKLFDPNNILNPGKMFP